MQPPNQKTRTCPPVLAGLAIIFTLAACSDTNQTPPTLSVNKVTINQDDETLEVGKSVTLD